MPIFNGLTHPHAKLHLKTPFRFPLFPHHDLYSFEKVPGEMFPQPRSSLTACPKFYAEFSPTMEFVNDSLYHAYSTVCTVAERCFISLRKCTTSTFNLSQAGESLEYYTSCIHTLLLLESNERFGICQCTNVTYIQC